MRSTYFTTVKRSSQDLLPDPVASAPSADTADGRGRLEERQGGRWEDEPGSAPEVPSPGNVGHGGGSQGSVP